MANSSTNCLRILQALSRNRRLVDLNLSWNNLSGAGTSVSEGRDAVEARQSAAAKYLAGKAPGLYAMNDVLGL